MYHPPKASVRAVALLVIVAMFAMLLGESAHTFLYEHEVCAEHGDLIHNHGRDAQAHSHEHDHHSHEDHSHEHVHAKADSQQRKDADSRDLPKATQVDSHEHCLLSYLARDEQLVVLGLQPLP